MKNRILTVSALAAALAMPTAFAQVAAGTNAGASAATKPAAATTQATTTTRPMQATPQASDRAVQAVSANPTSAARSAVIADGSTSTVHTPTTTIPSTTGAAATSTATTGTSTGGAAAPAPVRANSQGAANATTQAVEAVSANPIAAERSAVTAGTTATTDPDALSGTGQEISEAEAKQIRMEEAAARKAKRDARKKHK